MAKVTGPLFSLSASGQIAKSLVFMKWKGIDDVRKYVIPANPKSTDQLIQRGIFEDAVTEWHAAAYNTLDVAAWNLFASVQDKVMSGFNSMVKTFVKLKIDANVWTRLYGAWTSGINKNEFSLNIRKVAAGAVPKLWLGTNKTNMAYKDVFKDNADGTWYCTPTGLIANTDYYCTVKITLPALQESRLGIYKIHTLAA